MLWKLATSAALALLLLSGTVFAEDYKQRRVNLTIGVESFPQAAADLREVASEFDAQIHSLNMHHKNPTGNANLRVSPEQLSKLVAEMGRLGVVESQNQSVNDYGRNFLQYKQRLDTYRALQKVDLSSAFQHLPTEGRQLALSEYQNWLNSQIGSAESSLRSYREQSRYAEVHLNLNLMIMESPALTDQQENQTEKDAADLKATPPPQQSRRPSAEFFILCLINMAGLWMIYRKVDTPDSKLDESGHSSKLVN
jgi:hypothetical protein